MDISIIIPYNVSRGYLHEAVKSAENQIFHGTYEIIVQQGFYNVSKNINDAVKKANGDYIKLCSEDDILGVHCLELLFGRGYDFICANSWQPNEDFHEPFKSFIPMSSKHLAIENTIHGGTVLYKKSSLIKAGLFPENLNTGEEYELHMRMLKLGMKLDYIDAAVYAYRNHNKQKSTGDKTGEQLIARYREIDNIKNMYR